MYDEGFRSLKHIAYANPQVLASYGIPSGQIGDLQHEARQALPGGEVVFMVKSDKGEFLPIHNSRILLETIEKRLDLHKPLSGSILSITFQQLLSLQTEPWHLSCMTGNSLIWWQRLPKA
ncbi:hypothetical protein ABBQ38_009165 [Trebouxia sp. C0009 RCD-2024]